MSIIASFDKHPVYLDNSGDPLTSGKIHYYAIGTTTPKTVYTDYALTVPASNPQICGADGRTPTQIFLGTGQYTCVSRKFNGTDPNTAPDSDWENVTSQWVEEGQPTPSIASLTDAVYVTTIANLRLVDANALGKTNFMVMGYWSEGDMFPRTYHWDAAYLGADNKGTVIKNPMISTGAFILDVGNTDVMDCRIFGIMHNRAASNNAAIAAMVSDVQANAKLPQTIYFPRGIYEVIAGTQYFDTKVIFDLNCQFKNTSASDFILGVRSTFDNRSLQNIQASASTGRVILQFSNAADISEVDVRWFGCKCDGVTDDGANFEKAIAYTSPNYPFRIAGGSMVLTTLTGNITILNPLHFINASNIKNNQSTYNLIFAGSGYIRNNNFADDGTLAYCISPDNLNMYAFSAYSALRASFFGTVDLSVVISDLNPNLPYTQDFIFDVDSYFGNPLALESSDMFNFIHEKGQISSNTSLIYLPNFTAAQNVKVFINNYIIICNSVIYAPWFNNIHHALKCAMLGACELDLLGKSYSTSQAVDMTSCVGDRVAIKNGTISIISSITLLTVSASINNITLDNLFIYTATDANLLNINAVTLGTLAITNSDLISTLTTGGLVLYKSAGGNVQSVNISGCNIAWFFILADNVWSNSTVILSNCQRISGNLNIISNRCTITNSNFFGNPYLTSVTTHEPAIISGNTFTGHYLRIVSYNGYMKHIVTSNTFTGNDTAWTGVQILTRDLNTRFAGLIISNNLFDGTYTSPQRGIYLGTEGAGAWHVASFGDGHCIDISNNTSTFAASTQLAVPQTKCSFKATWIKSGTYTMSLPLASYAGYLLLIPDSPIQLGMGLSRSINGNFPLSQTSDITTLSPWNPQLEMIFEVGFGETEIPFYTSLELYNSKVG